MKILFLSRSTLFKDKGGDTFQIINTADNLRKMGVTVDIRLSSEKIDYSPYDLIHFFNIIRPADILPHLARSKKIYVVSPIFVDYSEYEKNVRTGIFGWILKRFSPDRIEYIKSIGRFILNGEKIGSVYYLAHGQKKSIQRIIKSASLLLPNSNSEYARLEKHYHLEQEYKVIPNGIDPHLFKNLPGISPKKSTLVICIARIEERKNQLNLIRALAHTSYQLILIGSPATNQKAYYEKCKQAATDNITFIDHIDQQALLDYYRRAKVHVLPSWFETTGLSSLEAAAMGCNIVITNKGDAAEYFKNFAYYCDPASPSSIFKAVDQAANSEINKDLAEMVVGQYNWEIAATRTLEGYRQILSNP